MDKDRDMFSLGPSPLNVALLSPYLDRFDNHRRSFEEYVSTLPVGLVRLYLCYRSEIHFISLVESCEARCLLAKFALDCC